MSRKVIILMALFMLFGGMACRPGKPIMTPERDIAAMHVSKSNVRKAIIQAATECGWEVKDLDKSTMQAKIVVRGKHTVVVNIPYTSKDYKIEYFSSINMEAENGKIHPNYNKWVKTLDNKIASKLL